MHSHSFKKIRLDELLVAKGLSESRSQAKALIMAGKVRYGTEILDKPGKTYPENLEIEIETPPRFVSRGGEKLEAYLNTFCIKVEGLYALDIGASTGGFTDCLLQRGIISSTCVDVGHGQLHSKLQNDPRVTNFEKINARVLNEYKLPRDHYDIIVMDLSFISLKKVLPAAWSFLAPQGRLIALVKPQFEAEKKDADKGRGIIRDEALQQSILQDITEFALHELNGSMKEGSIPSPIKGTSGNQEFLLGLIKMQ